MENVRGMSCLGILVRQGLRNSREAKEEASREVDLHSGVGRVP